MSFINLVGYFPQSGQAIRFDPISIVFAIIILIALLVNIKRGFIGALVSFFASIGGLILAVILCKPIGNMLYQTALGENIYSSVFGWISQYGGGILNNTVTATEFEAMMPEVLTQLNIPSILHNTIFKLLAPLVTEEGVNLAEAISTSLSTLSLTVISFLVIWLAAFIIFKLIGLLAKKINKVPFVGFVNRLLGGVFGILFGVVICYVICYGLTFFFSMSLPFSETLSEWMCINDESIWTFSKALYQNNLIQILIEMYL